MSDFDKLSKIEIWSNGVVFSHFVETAPEADEWLDAMTKHIREFERPSGVMDPSRVRPVAFRVQYAQGQESSRCPHETLVRFEGGGYLCEKCGDFGFIPVS